MTKENLNRKVEVRFSLSDFQRLKSLSKLANMSISRYVRTACFNKKIDAKFTQEERVFITRIFNIGNNLNQIARAINAQQKNDELLLRLRITLDHLDNFIDKMLRNDS
jgi:hypothetical protein